jgi:hypothetical protein
MPQSRVVDRKKAMLEKEIIQARGFANVHDRGQITGFRVRVRTPYYRGMWASLIEGADVVVDGQSFGRAQVTWTLAERTYSHAELAQARDARWAFDEPATLTIEWPGGLEPGVHDIEVAIVYRMSYMPAELQPTTYTARRKVTLVR